MRIKVNYDKCAGCKACELACSARHYQVYSTKLTRINIVKFEDKGVDIPVVCRQCINAPCIKNCPTQALYKDEKTNATLVNQDDCIGCGKCVEACPFSAVRLDENGTAMICDLCGGNPECVQVCATKAIEMQDIDTTSGKKRIAFAEKQVDSVLKKWGLK